MGEVPRDTDNLAMVITCHMMMRLTTSDIPPLLFVLPSGDIIRGGKCCGVCHCGAGPLYR